MESHHLWPLLLYGCFEFKKSMSYDLRRRQDVPSKQRRYRRVSTLRRGGSSVVSAPLPKKKEEAELDLQRAKRRARESTRALLNGLPPIARPSPPLPSHRYASLVKRKQQATPTSEHDGNSATKAHVSSSSTNRGARHSTRQPSEERSLYESLIQDSCSDGARRVTAAFGA